MTTAEAQRRSRVWAKLRDRAVRHGCVVISHAPTPHVGGRPRSLERTDAETVERFIRRGPRR